MLNLSPSPFLIAVAADAYDLLILLLIPAVFLLICIPALIMKSKREKRQAAAFSPDKNLLKQFRTPEGDLDRDALLIEIRTIQLQQNKQLQEIKSDVGCIFTFVVLLIVVWVVRMILVL